MKPPTGLAWLRFSAVVVVLDQASKWAMTQVLAYQEGIALAPFFNLVHVRNTGAAFSLFADQAGWQRGFFVIVALVISAVIVHLLHKTHGRSLFCLALALILGGAIGNVIDRLAYGYVVDFLDFYLGSWHWPAFNVADIAISTGAALLIWDSLAHKDPAEGPVAHG
jgi:signal peptidase II